MSLRIGQLLVTVVIGFMLAACGGGGSDSPANSGPAPPPPAPPPPDPTATPEWAFLVGSLEGRWTTEIAQLESEQEAAQRAAAAAGNYLSGGYLVQARDRFSTHVASYFNFAYDETIRWNNSSSITFERADIVVLLDDHRVQWLQYLDDFLASSFFNGHNSADLDNIIRPAVTASTNSAYNDTVARLDQWGGLASNRTIDIAFQGSWVTESNTLTITVQPSGNILGYDYLGCMYVGIVAAPNWLKSASRVVIDQGCGSTTTMLSGTILYAVRNAESSLILSTSSPAPAGSIIFVR